MNKCCLQSQINLVSGIIDAMESLNSMKRVSVFTLNMVIKMLKDLKVNLEKELESEG